MYEELDILLARYFNGEANADELRQLDVWLSESEEHEAFFEQMTLLYQKTGELPNMPQPNSQKALSHFKEHIDKPQNINAKKSLWKRPVFYGVIAASLALLVGVFVFINSSSQDTTTVYLRAESKDTPYRLNDNAEIMLFTGSEVHYHEKQKNEITLVGKASFSVFSENGESILVKAGETYIKDIGTKFTVTAFKPNEEITVEVQQGKVQFYTSDNPGLHLKENEIAYYDTKTKQFSYISKQSTIISESQSEDQNFAILSEEDQNELQIQNQQQSEKTDTESQKQKIKNDKADNFDENLEFNSAYLYEVIDILKNRYHVNIVFEDESMRTMRINISFSPHESIDNILNIITETLPVHISKNEKGYIISK